MGKLNRLELFNFKSYKGHHVLLFGDSYFTSIIGPNGSGKSNSMDAISFVLGIKSSYLRSSNVKDLVYRGRVLKHSKINADGDAVEEPKANQTNGHTNGDAGSDEEANTQTSTQRNDPTTAWVMAVYEDDAGEVQTWKRSITSAGASEYRLNNRSVTHKQYNDALEAENILVKARNFLVFQGDVEAIASQSPKDLTRLIEQISGSLEYKEDYERLLNENIKANEEQGFKLGQRRAMNSEIKQYQDQKREVENFERKAAERDEAIVTHVLWKLYHFQQAIEESGAEIQKHQEELKEFRRAQEKFEQKLEEAKRDQAKVTRDLSKVERNIKKKEKDVEDKENSLVPVNEKLAISNQHVSTYQARIAEISKTRDRQSQSVEQLKKDLATVEKAQSRWEKEWQQTQKQQGRQLSDSDLQEYNKLRGEVSKQTAAAQIEVDNLTRQLKTDEETANSLKSKVESLQEQAQRLEADGRGMKERRDDFSSQLNQTQKNVDEKKKEYTSITSHRVRNAQLHTEKEEKLQSVLMKLAEAENGQRETERQTRAKETVRQMKSIFPGVKGRVNELCKPKQKRYEAAVGIVLGKDWDSVVVDTEKTAGECIQYLKEQRIGIATFLPLDTMQVKSVNPNLKGMHRGMRLAIDTIEYDSAYERVMSSICGNAMICDDLKIAKYLCYEKGVQATAVTIDGTKIHKGGLMTGGAGRNDRQRRWDSSELESLHQVRIKLMADLASLNPQNDRRRLQEEETLQGELAGLEQSLNYLQGEIKALERNMQSKKKELDHTKSQLKEAQPKFKEQSQGVENIKAKLKSFQDSVSTVEDKVFASFCKRLGYENIRAYEAQQGSLQQEALKKKQEFSTQVSKLQSQLNFESTRLKATQDRITKMESEAKRDTDLIAGFEEEKQAIQEEIDTFASELELLNEELGRLQENAAKKSKAVSEQRQEFQKRSKNVEEKLRSIADLEGKVQRTSAERYALWRKCRIEEIKIPLLEDSNNLSSLPLNDVQGGANPDSMDVDEDESTAGEAVHDYGIEVDFTDLDEDLQENDSQKMDDVLQDKIKSLEGDLDKMAPNMRANERLEGVESRLKSSDKEFEAARRAAKKAKEDFEAVKTKRSELFQKAFNHISEQIQTVYKDLTRSAQTPLGGQAGLTPGDSDEPYLQGVQYHAMPPLKRFRDMEHLSGGEKTMAALALLFAVHSYQPSPFFVLDEVDAALDNANVAKLVGYIRRNAGPGMQFIVISLKAGLFEGSETLVGVMRDQGANSSKTLTLDLRKYEAV